MRLPISGAQVFSGNHLSCKFAGIIRLFLAFASVFFALLCPRAALAQDYMQAIGHPTFSSSEPVELGFIDAGNGNLHQEILLGSYPQRGGRTLTYKLVYDSRIWSDPTNVSWSPNPWATAMGGWRFVSSADSGGPVGFSTSSQPCYYGGDEVSINNFYWTAPDGTKRYFPFVTTFHADNTCYLSNTISASGYAGDSSGYYMSVTNYTQATVIAPDGTQVYPTYKDPDGNYYQKDANGNITADTLGRQPVIVTNPCGTNQICYDFLNSQGSARSRVILKTTSIPVHTNFLQQYVTEYSGNLTVLQSITLPDNTTYQFTYDSGSTAGHYGEITGITLPTNGTVSYGYTVYQDALSNKNRWVSQRTSGGHVWTYSLTGVSSPYQYVKVTEPSGDFKTYTFQLANGAWRNSVSYSTGMGITENWDTSHICQSPCTGSGPVNIQKLGETISQTVSPGGGSVSKQRQFAYNTQYVSLPSIIKEWNYGAAPATPTRITNITYY